MAFKNIADQTNGFYIPCVSLFGPGCAKEIGVKAQNFEYVLILQALEKKGTLF